MDDPMANGRRQVAALHGPVKLLHALRPFAMTDARAFSPRQH
jgi:hypothetical protein